MEDFPNEDQEEDKKKKKKHRLPSFLSTWLSRETESGEEKKESKKPFSERTWKVFQKFFSREAERPEKIEEEQEEKPEEAPQQFLEFTAPETQQTASEAPVEAKPVESIDQEAPQLLQPVEKEPEQSIEGGELVIDHREDEAEDWETMVEADYELPPDVEPPIIPLERRAEMAAMYTRSEEEPTATTSQPEKIGDVLDRRLKQDERNFIREKQRNRRRNRRLKKQVRELKREDEAQSKDNEVLKKEQKELKDQVERLRQQPDVSKLIARQERERAELRANRGITTPENQAAKPIIKTEAVSTPVPESRPRQPEVQREAPRAPDMAFQSFERIPREDTRSERDFERRHEVKDEAGSPQAASYVALASADAAYRAAAVQIGQAAAARSYPAPPPAQPLPQPAFQASDLVDSPMYRQAMRNGFLTAIILLAVWFVISLLN